MARLTPRLGPAELAARFAELRVDVARAEVETCSVPLADYPGDGRPSGTVIVTGRGQTGRGENVAFSTAAQRDFRAVVARWFEASAHQRPLRVGTALGDVSDPYERAALEAALLDLALRQAGLTVAELTGVLEAELDFVVSLAADPSPLPEIARLRAAGFTGSFKVDIDPGWPRDLCVALAREPGIAILDFKTRGDAALVRHLAALFPGALFEDPPDSEAPATSRTPPHLSRDATLRSEADVLVALKRGESVNLKAPRMGGPLAVLNALEHAWRASPTPQTSPLPLAYMGGMFEVGIGREQARLLASLYCPHAPNDLASNGTVAKGERRALENPPRQLRLDVPGFGYTLP